MGVELLGGLSAGNALFNQAGSIYSSERQLKAQQRENQLNREYQTQERLAAQVYNTQERLDVQQYNRPENMVQRFKDAGLNPTLAMGGTSQGVVQPQSSSGQSSPGGITPVANPFQGGLGSNFAEIVDGLSKVGLFESNKKLINEEVRSYLLKNSGQEVLNEIQSIELEINKSLKDTRINKAFEEYTQSVLNTALMSKDVDLKQAQIELTKASKVLQDALSKYHGEKAIIANILGSRLITIIESWVTAQKSVARSNNAAAAESDSRTVLNKIDANSRVELNDAIIAKLSEDVRESISRQGINQWQAKVVEYTADKLMPEANHSELVFWKEFMKDIVNTGIDAFATYSTRGFYKALDSNAKSRIDNEIKRMEKDYAPHTDSDVYYNKHGEYIGRKEHHYGGR